LPTPPPRSAGLALLYAVVFVEIGIAMPFMPVWLDALGLDARIIGLLLAIPIATRIVATAPLMSLIDRGIGPRRLVLLASLGLALTYAMMPTAAAFGWPLLAVLVAVNAIAGAPLVPSIDYLTLAAVRRDPRLAYARIRMAGSIGFLMANLAGGALLAGLGGQVAVPLLLTGLALFASAVAAASQGPEPAEPRPAPVAGRPPLPRVLWLSIAAAALVQASHSAIYGFAGIYWTAHGLSTAAVGALWAVGVAAEIVLFALVGRLPDPWRSPFRLLAMGGAAAAVRALGMAAFGSDPLVAGSLQLLHAFTFGATQLGVMAAVSRFAPEGARGRAQGTLSAVNALAAAGSTLMSGLAYREAGPVAFLLMAPLALAGLTLTALAARKAKRPRFGPGPFDRVC